MKTIKIIALALLTTAVVGTAPRVAAAQDADGFDDKWLTLGLKTGVYVPSIINDRSPHVDLALEAGVMLPVADRRLGLMFEAAWAPPGVSDGKTDPRVGEDGGEWDFDVTTHEVKLSLGPMFRFLPPGETFVPYIGALARMYLIRTNVNGTGDGQSFGENTEVSTELGFVGLLGGELQLGPGAALLEVSFGWSDLPHRITGDTSTGALSVLLGYRLML
ncbi:MAG: hypothetical protein ACODAU_13430 [Myxococcota bacterium]